MDRDHLTGFVHTVQVRCALETNAQAGGIA